jgi:hypothetical protein
MTTIGCAAIAGLMLVDVGGTAFDYIAIGTLTTAASTADTALGAEKVRKASTGSRVTTSGPNDTAQLVVSFSSLDAGLTGTMAISEVGVFNAASNGTLLMHQVYTADSLKWTPDGDTLTVTVKLQVKQGS